MKKRRIIAMLVLCSFLTFGCGKNITKYKITWLDFDNSILKQEEIVEGLVPCYKDRVPYYTSGEDIFYFDEWQPEVVPAYQDATYKAKYINNSELFSYVDDNICVGYRNAKSRDYFYDGVVHIPSKNGNTVVNKIGSFVESGESLITKFVIPKTITKLYSETNPFATNYKLEEIEIEEGNTAFVYEDKTLYMSNKTKIVSYLNFEATSINIGSSIRNIVEYAFDDCLKVSSYTVESENNYFSSYNDCLMNKTQSTLYLYPKMKNGKSFSTPSTTTKIANGAFLSNHQIETLSINEGVTFIGWICDCENLQTLNLPSTFEKTYSNGLIYGCKKLTSIKYEGTVQQWSNNFRKLDYEFKRNSNVKTIICLDGTYNIE